MEKTKRPAQRGRPLSFAFISNLGNPWRGDQSVTQVTRKRSVYHGKARATPQIMIKMSHRSTAVRKIRPKS